MLAAGDVEVADRDSKVIGERWRGLSRRTSREKWCLTDGGGDGGDDDGGWQRRWHGTATPSSERRGACKRAMVARQRRAGKGVEQQRGLIRVCGYLIVAKVRAGRQVSHPEPDSYLDVVDISQLSVHWGTYPVCGYLIVARVRAGRQVSRPELESAGLLPRFNDLLMVCYLLRDLGGAQLVMEEPSLSRRSPALQSKMGVTSPGRVHSSKQTQQSQEQSHVVAAPGCCPDILMGGDRWCALCLEISEEPSSSWRSPFCRGGAQAYRVKWGYGLGLVWPWAGRNKEREREKKRRERRERGKERKRRRRERELRRSSARHNFNERRPRTARSRDAKQRERPTEHRDETSRQANDSTTRTPKPASGDQQRDASERLEAADGDSNAKRWRGRHGGRRREKWCLTSGGGNDDAMARATRRRNGRGGAAAGRGKQRRVRWRKARRRQRMARRGAAARGKAWSNATVGALSADRSRQDNNGGQGVVTSMKLDDAIDSNGSCGSIGKRVMVTIHMQYQLLFGLIRVCGYLIVARVRAGRQVSRPEPESAGLLPRLNDL
ncbi:hypothetical protein Scep_007612 [Stephania cephalantha]|uniref:Uncharacterized protein n=1 Tax=Stephania cephalantha TaxID=152367 RepID=A0AAP0PP01_9MAGN